MFLCEFPKVIIGAVSPLVDFGHSLLQQRAGLTSREIRYRSEYANLPDIVFHSELSLKHLHGITAVWIRQKELCL
jgi:hypothetical protein